MADPVPHSELEVSRIIFSENREWFDQLTLREQAEVLEREGVRNAEMEAEGIGILTPVDFD